MAIAAAATLSLGSVGPGVASAADSPLEGLDLSQLGDLLENEILQQYLEACQSAAADADGEADEAPTTDLPEDIDPADLPAAIADCSQSSGTGLALVAPGSIEVAELDQTFDLPAYGEKNVIELANQLANGSLGGLIPPSIRFSTYDEVAAAAALEENWVTERYCDGFELFGRCIGTVRERTTDTNADRRNAAKKVIEYLSVGSLPGGPFTSPEAAKPHGSATVIGDGIQVALAIAGGTAVAESYLPYSIATAAAQGENTSTSYAVLGMANALNTDTIGLTWFGRPLDLSNIEGLANLAGTDVAGLDELEVPGLKEVSCYGVLTVASADGLGSCANVLGTFDYFERPAVPADEDGNGGVPGEVQYGLTDVTSLILGEDALLKDLDGFIGGALGALTSEDERLMFAKDFVRLTMRDGEDVTAMIVTSDYGLTSEVVIEWMGKRIVLFPEEEVNGKMRPNLLGMPRIEDALEESDGGIIPTISLVQIAHPFGLGTLSLDNIFDPIGTLRAWRDTVTLGDDLQMVGGLLGLTDGSSDDDADASGTEDEAPEDEDASEIADRRIAARSESTSTTTSSAPVTTSETVASETATGSTSESTTVPTTSESSPAPTTDAPAPETGSAEPTEPVEVPETGSEPVTETVPVIESNDPESAEAELAEVE